jgi:hypothetical protein
MQFIALSLLLQIICAAHCVKTKRSGMWLTVIMLLSVPGCIAYLLFEVLPPYLSRREVKAAGAAAARAIDPTGPVRRARDALETADTAANRMRLADALGAEGQWAEAILHYEEAVERAPRGDAQSRLALASALLEAGSAERARLLVEEADAPGDKARLLHARTMEETGEPERALLIYAELGERMAGGEALCRQAALLLAQGREEEALAPLVEVERRLRRIDKFERAAHSEMYCWAERTLAELRAGQSGA